MGSSPRALPDHSPYHAMRRSAGKTVQLGSTFALQHPRSAPTASAAAAPVPASVLPQPDEHHVHGHYDPAFHRHASAASMVFWSIYGAAILAACALFFLFN